MELFTRADFALPYFWSYMAWDQWRSNGSIQPQTLVVADINHDGRDDLLFQFWQDQGHPYGLIDAGWLPNRLVFLLSSVDGYIDATAAYFGTPDVSLGGTGINPVAGDLDGDGDTDFVFYANREDGRSAEGALHVRAKCVVIRNDGGQEFTIVEFGPEAWWFSAGIFDWAGKTYFWTSGSWMPTVLMPVYILEDGVPVEEMSVPSSAASGFTPVTWLSGEEQLDYLVTVGSVQGHPLTQPLLFKWIPAWGYVALPATPMGVPVEMQWTAWNGDRQAGTAWNIDGEVVVGGHAWSEAIRVNPNMDPVVVYKFSGTQVGPVRADGNYDSSERLPFTTFEFYSVRDDSLVRVPFTLVDEQIEVNSETTDVLDVNLDGLDDIVVYPYGLGGAPIVYLSTGAGVFAHVPATAFPKAPAGWGEIQSTSRFIEADGLPGWDLIYFLGNDGMGWAGAPAPDYDTDPVIYVSTGQDYGDHVTASLVIQDRYQSPTIRLFAGNDVIHDNNVAGGMMSRIEGGAGLDTAIYGQFDVTVQCDAAGVIHVLDATGELLHDALMGFERIVTKSSAFAFDLDGAAGKVAKALGAVFGPAAISNQAYVGIGLSLLDGGMSEDELMDLALAVVLGDSRSNEAVVSLLYENVVGRAPSPMEVAHYASMIVNAHLTQESLGWLAAAHDLNLIRIGFVGLEESGLQYLPVA